MQPSADIRHAAAIVVIQGVYRQVIDTMHALVPSAPTVIWDEAFAQAVQRAESAFSDVWE